MIIQGDHPEKSRKRFSQIIKKIKSKGWEIRRIDSSQNVSEQFTQVSLFEEKLLFIIEEPLKLLAKDLKWISKNQKGIEGNLLIYHQGYIPKKIINLLPKQIEIEDYKIPKLIWNFLDSIYPGNTKEILQILHNVIETEPKEFIFSLIVGRVKELYWIKIDEKALKYPSWRLNKLKFQAKKFKKEMLKEIIDELSKIDIRVKTSSENLIDALDLLIISKLE